jgi:hypothetical protein
MSAARARIRIGFAVDAAIVPISRRYWDPIPFVDATFSVNVNADLAAVVSAQFHDCALSPLLIEFPATAAVIALNATDEPAFDALHAPFV